MNNKLRTEIDRVFLEKIREVRNEISNNRSYLAFLTLQIDDADFAGATIEDYEDLRDANDRLCKAYDYLVVALHSVYDAIHILEMSIERANGLPARKE